MQKVEPVQVEAFVEVAKTFEIKSLINIILFF